MLDIVFSIPIHERLEVVVDQIINFRHFNPNCGFIFHFSQNFDYEKSGLTRIQFEEIVSKIGNIYINPNSLRTGLSDIIQAHLSNYQYIKDKIQYEYFVMSASNELFIKSGFGQFIKDYDCGVEQLDVTDWTNNSHFSQDAKNDKFTQDILKYLNYDRIIFSHIEGQYYKKDLFNTIYTAINANYDYKSANKFYPREEYYFSTVIGYLKQMKQELKIGPVITYNAYHFDHLWDAKPSEINYLLKNSELFYSVKRVNRLINDNVRCYLRQKNGYLESEVSLMGNHIKLVKKNRIAIVLQDFNKFVSTLWDKRTIIMERSCRKLGITNNYK